MAPSPGGKSNIFGTSTPARFRHPFLTPQSIKFNRFPKLILLKQATFDVSQHQNAPKVAFVQGELTGKRLNLIDCGVEFGCIDIVGSIATNPHGGVPPFHRKSTCMTRSTLGPNVVQIRSRNSLELRVNQTLDVHLVDASNPLTLLRLVQGYLAHKKTPTPLGPPEDPRHMPAVGS
jgi:hypothetical protein